MRGVLPAASLSNVGIYGTGQGYEALLLRMRSHPLPESRAYADLMLTELRKVIPSFLKRVDLDDRGVAWSTYLATTRSAMEEIAGEPVPRRPATRRRASPAVQLLDWDPDGEVKLVAAMLYSHTHVSEAVLEQRVRAMTADERLAVIRAYVGERANRRHKPGRALERLTYRFDVLADYGAFRDLQRHRMLSIEWQQLSPRHGFTRPEAVDLAGCRRALRRGDGALGVAPRRAGRAVPRPGRLRRVARLQGALLPPPQRPGGHAPARAAHHPAGPPGLPGGRPGDAPPHRRAGRPPGRGRGDALRRPLARSPASSASTPSGGPRPGARHALTRFRHPWLGTLTPPRGA